MFTIGEFLFGCAAFFVVGFFTYGTIFPPKWKDRNKEIDPKDYPTPWEEKRK